MNPRLSGPRPDALAKLSYAPMLVDQVGFEPTPSRLQGGCSPRIKLQARNVVLQTGFEPALDGISFHFLYRGLGYWSI